VALSGATSATGTADTLGNYTFCRTVEWVYTVTAEAYRLCFHARNQSATVNGANVSGVNFTATSQTFSISGTISPVAEEVEAAVTLSGAQVPATTANSSGAYTFVGWRAGLTP